MSDITKCEGKDCPIKENCFRFTVKSNSMWQSYFMEVPYNKETKNCEFYYER